MKQLRLTKEVKKVLAFEAKATVLLAFRNGPIESVHAGERCPTCHGKAKYSRITQAEMKEIMKNAVDWVYTLSLLRLGSDQEEYASLVEYGNLSTIQWDEPRRKPVPDASKLLAALAPR